VNFPARQKCPVPNPLEIISVGGKAIVFFRKPYFLRGKYIAKTFHSFFLFVGLFPIQVIHEKNFFFFSAYIMLICCQQFFSLQSPSKKKKKCRKIFPTETGAKIFWCCVFLPWGKEKKSCENLWYESDYDSYFSADIGKCLTII